MALRDERIRNADLYPCDPLRAQSLLEASSKLNPRLPLSRRERQRFYNSPGLYLREDFVRTDLFQTVYQEAKAVFWDDFDSGNTHVPELAGALFQAYGMISLHQSEYVQSGFTLMRDREKILEFYSAMYQGTERVRHNYDDSVRGISVPDALIVVDTGDRSFIQHDCEITLTDRSDNSVGVGHFGKSLNVFRMHLEDPNRSDLYMPTASLLYVVPKDFGIIFKHNKTAEPVDIINVSVDAHQWGEYMDFVLYEYRSGEESSTLAELYEASQGRSIPGRKRRALLHPVEITRANGLGDELSVANLLKNLGLDDNNWNGSIPGNILE